MKVKDLPKNQSLTGILVKTPKGVIGYWKSQWGYENGKAGVWLSDGKSSRIYPQFLNKLKEALEWEVTDEKPNCHLKTGMKNIDLTK